MQTMGASTPVESHGKDAYDGASALIKSAIGYDVRFEYADGCPYQYVFGTNHRRTMATISHRY